MVARERMSDVHHYNLTYRGEYVPGFIPYTIHYEYSLTHRGEYVPV